MKPKFTLNVLLLALILSTALCGCQSSEITSSVPLAPDTSSAQDSDTSTSSPETSDTTTSVAESSLPEDTSSDTDNRKIEIEKHEFSGASKPETVVAYYDALTNNDMLITDENFDEMYQLTFGDSLVTDKEVLEKVQTLANEHAEITEELFVALTHPANVDVTGITKELREEFLEIKADKTATVLTDLNLFYEKQKALYSDISDYDDFLDKFSFLKTENGKLYVKGMSIGKTTLERNTGFDRAYTGFSSNVFRHIAVVKSGEKLQLAFPIINCQATPETDKVLCAIATIDLEEKDGKYRLVRDIDWENAYGKGGK